MEDRTILLATLDKEAWILQDGELSIVSAPSPVVFSDIYSYSNGKIPKHAINDDNYIYITTVDNQQKHEVYTLDLQNYNVEEMTELGEVLSLAINSKGEKLAIVKEADDRITLKFNSEGKNVTTVNAPIEIRWQDLLDDYAIHHLHIIPIN